MFEYRKLIIAVVILISIINQSALPGMSISDSESKNPANPQAILDGEKLPRTIILDPHEILKMKQAIMKQNDSNAQDFLKTIITEADSVLQDRKSVV